MNYLTAISIAQNYKDGNILVEAYQNKDSKKWFSELYIIRDGRIHTTLLSFEPTTEFDGFETKEIALKEMNGIVDLVVKKYDEEYLNNNEKV